MPAMPVGKREPLQHHERVQLLGEKRVAHVVGQPLMETARPVSVSILRAFAFKLFQKPRAKPFIDEVSGVIGDDAVAVLAHARPCPALEAVNIFIELIGKFFGPGGKLLPDQDFEIPLQGILGADLFIALASSTSATMPVWPGPGEKLGLLRLRQLLCLEGSRLPGAEPDVADHDQDARVEAPHDPVAIPVVDGFQGPVF